MTNHTDMPQPVVLTIAGSDSGGGAGIQADLKAIQALGCFGTTAITCVTAQNPDGVFGVEAISAQLVRKQIDAVFSSFPVAAVKTGMLFSAEIVQAVVNSLADYQDIALVVDPVMVATSGASLLRNDAVISLTNELLPLATVMTPNVPEAEVLLDGMQIVDLDTQKRAALLLSSRFGCACALKGGHLPATDEIVDVLSMDGEVICFRGLAVAAQETHGTGCTFASACAAWLARGASLPDAVAGAKKYVAAALQNSRPAGKHWPLGNGDTKSSI